jgi:hypothetical protein
VFIGQDTNSGGSTVDLSQFKSPNSSADAVNGLMVSLAANSTGNPGSVSATVNEPAATPVTFAQFANINEVIRSAFIPTVVDSGTATGVTLVTAQAVVFTSTPPSPAMQGGTYVPMATGGGSGNPVVFSVDAASAPGSCALTGGTIRFTGAGSCVIDANQAGNSQYQAAPEAQQTIPVTQGTAGATGGTSGGAGATGGTGGATGATGGTGGGGSPSVSAQQILVLLVTEITPSTRARIRALLKAGGFTLMFKALAAGTVVIAWYELPPGAHLARNRPKPVLVAKGQISFASAGTRKLKVRLTAVGKRLLGSVKHVRLTSKGTFTPFGRPAVTAIRAFALKR